MNDTALKLIKDIQKEFGLASIRMGGVTPEMLNIDVISSGSAILDNKVLLVGGFPRGRITEVAGKEGGGKTTVCLHTITEAQKMDLIAVYIDAEHKLDLSYAQALGVDLDSLIIVYPDNGEHAIDIADRLVDRANIGLLVFDSAAALGSKKEQEDAFADNADVAKVPRLLNKFFRRRMSDISTKNIAVIFTNQLREKIGFMQRGTGTTGGRGLQHYCSILMRITRVKNIKQGDNIIGQVVKATTSKNNVAMPFRAAELEIYYGRGIDPEGDILDYAKELGIVAKRGAFYSYKGDTIAQGKVKSMQALRDNPELRSQIVEDINAKNNNI